ncbi:GLABROUS1 enhancer-binding protein family [Arabidopsis thaliana x Arabidopsis arenosa]|uniref:GLABROUS1 enhancer-binding protein family n=1 Tax=Arabidopsis thaliana x Arabidopsis arenosa TaxID=1240361 RepID=A0A8T2B769_9BRAS|nr:GLABROUS1 enhancer-binding protein family [Arabidopsis thaliana x Arabidopsis arenosa]
MAKKLLNPLEDPPTASSSDDDDEVEISSEEDEEQISNSEDPATIPSTKTLKSPSAAAPSPDSGSETDSDSDKPHVFTKKKEATDLKSVKKRASEGTTSKDKNVKKAKKVLGDDDNKKPRFQRLWTDEDEISLLQGMIDFKAETGTSPYDDMNKFFDIAKESISFDVSKNQFGDKIRGLKKKYFGKRKKKSVESDHDKKCLELAKSIWGLDGIGVVGSPVKSKKKKDESVVKANGKEKNLESLVEEDKEVGILGGDSESSNWFDKSFLVRVVASLGVDECIVKWKWSKVSVETKKKIEEKMKLVEAKEFELLSQKVDILKEVTSVIAETI